MADCPGQDPGTQPPGGALQLCNFDDLTHGALLGSYRMAPIYWIAESG